MPKTLLCNYPNSSQKRNPGTQVFFFHRDVLIQVDPHTDLLEVT